MNTLKKILYAVIAISTLAASNVNAQDLPKGKIVVDKEQKDLKIYSFVAPGPLFANATHIIELKHQLILVDGQFFAPYAKEIKAFTDSIGKPVSRIYISHDHPDHYLGFGDAFPNAEVYALNETKQVIEKDGPATLAQRQKQYGAIIASKLNLPKHVQNPGKETIDGVPFIFEKSLNNEDAVSLVIKLPSAKTYIAQDIVFNKIHLFMSDNTKGWESALNQILKEKSYDLILGGHGFPGNKATVTDDLNYLNFANKILSEAKTKAEYKEKLLAAYPEYSGNKLIDIYLAYYIKNKHWQE